MLSFVKDKTEKLCLFAVEQDGMAIQYVDNQTVKLCLVAVKQD